MVAKVNKPKKIIFHKGATERKFLYKNRIFVGAKLTKEEIAYLKKEEVITIEEDK